MQRVRVTVKHNPDDPADDLRWAARVRRDLWAHSPVEIDPDSPRHGTHRDERKNAFFDFATDRLKEVQRVLQEYGHAGRAEAIVVQDDTGTECVNCGNITPGLVSVCPTCRFRDIAPCPHCNHEIPRLECTPQSPGICSSVRCATSESDCNSKIR
ncbi:MAG TPA: hypothetical protein VGX78_07205, partial [Pirellulales bacterium]|nr:hypothetical protein [Pirellulales bacterium]